MTKVFIASDHAGVELKSKVLEFLRNVPFANKFEVHDMGPFSKDSVDYPDFADLVCRKIHGLSVIDSKKDDSTHPTEIGILICGSGQGMAMRANKYPHIRAALAWTEEVIRLARDHNDANVLCLGSRLLPVDLCLRMVEIFLTTDFSGGRHRTRVLKVSQPLN